VKYSILVATFALMAVACSSSSGATGANGEDCVHVATTVSPITNIVQNIGGSHICVTGIVPEGTNSHTFEPAPSDAKVMADADIVFINGLHLEDPTKELADANVQPGVPVISLGEETITPDQYIYDFSFPQAAGDPNPHLWTDPLYAKRYGEIVRDELSKVDPANAADYRANEAAFAKRIDQLDRIVREVTASVPPENRKLLTYHDSFPYFAREYGWQIIGAIQPSDFADPTPQEVAALIDQIKREHVPAIFGSEVFPSPVLEQIASETGAQYVDDLRDDDLPGENGDPDHSYFGIMAMDFKTFMGALGGDITPFDHFDVTNLQGGDTANYRY
jgi:ABC-type Zn uptake system ZnuABC Zn-binding protein ZnuA